MTDRAPWEAPDDPDADDVTWRGDAHPALPPTALYGPEYRAWLDKQRQEDALTDLLGDAPIVDDDDQC